MKHIFGILIITLLGFQAYAAKTLHITSGLQQTTLIELYTSEGCSSCPAADQWLSKFKQSDLLWQHVVPVAFHVNYWDYLGWKDVFASNRYTNRQYKYRSYNYVSAVYTPGVMKNGREFRGWRWGFSPLDENIRYPGELSADVSANTLKVLFNGKQLSRPLILNIAWLGTNIKSPVAAGENNGEILNHDFVVLDFQQVLPQKNDHSLSWDLLRNDNSKDPRVTAIALWISELHNPTPIQAAGAWLHK